MSSLVSSLSKVNLLYKYRHSMFISHLVVFVASLSAFLEQPLVGRMLLPYAGGGAAAWVATLMFFQVFLVGGYLVGYKLSKTSGKFSLLLSVGIIAGPLTIFPALIIFFSDSILGIVSGMLLLIPGYVVLTSTLILVSNRTIRLFSRKNPYRLAGTSNAGSFFGLFLGLLFTEFIPLTTARFIWWGLLIFVVLSLVLLLYPMTKPADLFAEDENKLSNISKKNLLKWGGLAAFGSAFLVSYSGWFNENVIVMPLLWVLPLALYLAIFSIMFSGVLQKNSTKKFLTKYWSWIVLGLFAAIIVSALSSTTVFGVFLGMIFFAIPVWFILSKLEATKPVAASLSSFWIVVAVGGAVGGTIAGVLFPILFNGFWEIYPLFLASFVLVSFTPKILGNKFVALVSSVLFGVLFFYTIMQSPIPGTGSIWASLMAVGAAAGSVFSLNLVNKKMAVVVVVVYSIFGIVGLDFFGKNQVVSSGRGIYGSWVVFENKENQEKLLSHNGIVHGFQSLKPSLSDKATSYYGSGTGVGNVFETLENNESIYGLDYENLNVGIVGLGVGTLSAWQKKDSNQSWTFFEIDPEMVNVANGQFSFLSGSEKIIIGDARLMLQEIPDNSLDVLVLDAYLGDSVPTHLMTVEAYELFARKIKENGIILSHVSNIYLNVDRVVVGSAQKNNMVSLIKNNAFLPETENLPSRNGSYWILSTKNNSIVEAAENEGWKIAGEGKLIEPVVWTDELTPFLKILKW
jgi:hypothetical protein